MPSSRQVGSMDGSIPRDTIEYSICKSQMGSVAAAHLIPTSDRPTGGHSRLAGSRTRGASVASSSWRTPASARCRPPAPSNLQRGCRTLALTETHRSAGRLLCDDRSGPGLPSADRYLRVVGTPLLNRHQVVAKDDQQHRQAARGASGAHRHRSLGRRHEMSSTAQSGSRNRAPSATPVRSRSTAPSSPLRPRCSGFRFS
jgi:hypothetical protein